ncbi:MULTISPECIES: Vomp family autotransporter [unclassified Bartonella]|uniref:Vomp family autotransporter n=1 Tax=unclassified Bartonella TaxID=2645622 RepID=UPI00235DDA68|nr:MULTISPECIES: Vomp family autotransporter [unclassified Bartonella]
MKKLYTKLAGSDLKFSRFPFIKVLSLTSIAALLSSVSPVFSKNLDSKEEISTDITDIKTVAVAYPQSVISVYDTSADYLGPLDVSKGNYVTVLNTALTPKVNASGNYAIFLTNILSDMSGDNFVVNILRAEGSNLSKRAASTKEKKKQPIISPQLFARSNFLPQQPAQNDEDSTITDVFDTLHNDSATRIKPDAELPRDVLGNNVIFGNDVMAKVADSVVIGSKAKASLDDNTKDLSSSVIIGANAEAHRGGSVAVGADTVIAEDAFDAVVVGRYARAGQNSAIALGFKAKGLQAYSIAIGSEASASFLNSMALGLKSQAIVESGVAIGAYSVADVSGAGKGYSPLEKNNTNRSDYVWRSKLGAVSVGDNTNEVTRQITGVAAGSKDTDAVNIAQLKELQDYVNKGWKLSINGANDAVAIAIDSSIDLAAGSSNFEVTKGDKDNKVKFDLAKDLTLKSIKLGEESISDDRADAVSSVTLDTTGLIIENGPQIITTGIKAGSKKITGVAKGTEDTDAVNFGQLQKVEKDVKEQVAASSFVKQDGKTKYITIGKETDGDKIDITNKNNGTRTLTGLKSASLSEVSNEAVTGSQLFTTNKNVTTLSDNFKTAATNMAKYFGGNAKYENGTWIDPTFTIKTVNADGEEKEESYSNVAEALSGVGTSFTNIQNKITNDITKEVNKTKGDALLWNNEKEAFVAQHGEGETKTNSKISFLANGDIAENSTDAINGSQLYSMSNNLAAYLGDSAGYKDGKWEEFTFKVNTVKEDGTASEESYNTVEKAFSAVGTSFTNIQNKITDEITKEINKTKGDALLWNNEKEAFVAQHGEGETKTNSKISFLANGDIAENSTDAINGSQLYSMSNNLAAYFGDGAGYKDGQWKKPTFYVSQFKNDGNGDDKTDYDNVADAFGGVNDSMKSINERIKNVSSNGLNWNETDKAYDARHNNQDSKITHVADGKVSEDSKEAVNGSQLWETNNRVSKVEEQVGSIDKQIKNIENTVTNDAVKYDKGEDGKKTNKITLVGGNESDPVLLDNVADGKIEKDSKEAVNGSQLWETNQQMKVVLDNAKKYTDERFHDLVNSQMGDVINEAKSYTDMKFDSLNYSIENVRKEARQAAAIGLAVANLRYNETPGKLSVGFGSGLWRNQSAFAFGAGYTSESGSVLSNVSVTNSGGHWGIGAGFNMTLN